MEIAETTPTAPIMLQPSELLPLASQWQRPTIDVVAKLADGRKVRQVNDYKLEVTTYKGQPATPAELSTQIERLRRNYTQMKPDFFAILTNELAADEWPIERIKDAVTHVLRTKTGGFIGIADIFNYDKPMKLYNYGGYCWLINNFRAQDKDGCGPLSDFGKIIIDGKCFWYLKKDLPQKKY